MNRGIIVRNRGAYELVHGDLPSKAAPVWDYLEVYRPCAGGLSAVNAIATQLCNPITGDWPDSVHQKNALHSLIDNTTEYITYLL